MYTDLTVAEAICDPMIALMLRADGLDKAAFAELLNKAACQQMNQRLASLQESRATEFYGRLAACEPATSSCASC